MKNIHTVNEIPIEIGRFEVCKYNEYINENKNRYKIKNTIIFVKYCNTSFFFSEIKNKPNMPKMGNAGIKAQIILFSYKLK